MDDIVVDVDASVEGVRVRYYSVGGDSSWLGNMYILNVTTVTTSSLIITQDLPSGSFSSTISSSFGTALVEDWEDGADIQYKLTNATEDTGWLTYNEVSTFTAFTSEPTKCIVKLIPKTTSPQVGVPSIKGFYVGE